VPALVVAGVASGVGKTTLTLGLLEALRRRGLAVQPFKIGPDFIDPGFHTLAAGRQSWTLDGWMCGRPHAEATLARAAARADVALIEGVMGCFDGVAGDEDAGSTAEMARWLGAPVLLVLDAGAQARSAAAVVLGFERFDPELELAGVILNRVAGPGHRAMLAAAIGGACRTPVLGALPPEPDLALPERHLGLVTAQEGGYTGALGARLGRWIEEHVDLDAVLRAARSRVRRAGATPAAAEPPGAARPGSGPRVGVAQDQAFCFYYPENLALLEAQGARLVFFSPVADRTLPEVEGLYLGGGYPELHAAALADNSGMRRAVAEFVRAGRPVYAECGGLMYLCRAIEDPEGRRWPMAEVLPATARMADGALTLGYRRARLLSAGPLGPGGLAARGHEFHASRLDPAGEPALPLWQVEDARGGAPRPEGFVVGRAVASYVHLHFASEPALAGHFVEACAR
jgi:cobyrinic acid a,c-diamide synthase